MNASARPYPRPWRANYVQLRALRAQLLSRLACRFGRGAGISILDVGCGDRPYQPLLDQYIGQYVGFDVEGSSHVDVVGSAEELPFEDATFDCVICTQVLQYVNSPALAVREMHRVLRTDGMLLLSTHGVSFVDRRGVDRWRWTHHGLKTLLNRAGTWQEVEVLPAGGVFCAASYLVGGQAESAAHRLGMRQLAAPICLALNAAAWNADRMTRRLFPELPPEAAVNYLAIARAT